MKSKSGFTIVELVVTISVIAILASISLVTYSFIQRDARDTTRRGNVRVITEALEKYYDKNGEYPSVRQLVNNFGDNSGANVAVTLNIDAQYLKMPRMTPTTQTNALYSGGTPINDYVVYIGYNANNNVHCQSGPPHGCDEFTLQYKEESGTTVTIESRRKGHPTN
jgi:prepilin-type N-terminal cleavage/methylation domain-containing protein